jgi:hypothetical protein
MSGRAFCELVRHCPKLTHISVALISELDDLLLSTLEKSCPALEAVTVSRSNRLTAAGIRRLVSGCGGIKQLDISNSSNLTDNGLVHIAKLGGTLRVRKVLGSTFHFSAPHHFRTAPRYIKLPHVIR